MRSEIDVRSPLLQMMSADSGFMKMKTHRTDRLIILANVAGILISTYALYVEMAAEAKPGYKALCDIGENAKCTRVLTSKYSKGFGLVAKDSILKVPNCVYGIVFYCAIIVLTTYVREALVKLQLFLSICSVVSVVYLGYLLLFVLKDFCIVCVSTYFVNATILYYVYQKLKIMKGKID